MKNNLGTNPRSSSKRAASKPGANERSSERDSCGDLEEQQRKKNTDRRSQERTLSQPMAETLNLPLETNK